VLRLRIPPLRARLEDIPALVSHLMRRVTCGAPCTIDERAVEVLSRHSWPGNVRELYHTLERAWLVGGGQITAELLENDLQSTKKMTSRRHHSMHCPTPAASPKVGASRPPWISPKSNS